jgi:3-phosphoshikimate 1-carboxyvinyltransferase
MSSVEIVAGMRSGTIEIPPSKSDSQRALLAAALVNGKSTLCNLGVSNDEQTMLKNIVQLGAEQSQNNSGDLEIEGISDFPPAAILQLGESGLGMRLITSVLAAHNGTYILHPEGSLKNRPYQFFVENLPKFGANVTLGEEVFSLKIQGPMHGATTEVDGSHGSQYISGLLMALPLVNGDSHITVLDLKSKPYVEMTLRTLEGFGIEITHQNLQQFIIRGNQNYLPTKYVIESDWSSAAFWLVAAALGHDFKIKNLSVASYQADKAILDAFKAANCIVKHNADAITVDGSARRSFFFDATHCPDLFPALTIFALFCEGISTIRGVHRLLNKESNRAKVLLTELHKTGAHLHQEDDDLIIHQSLNLHHAQLDPANDHRMAMAFAILGISSKNGVTIQDASCVNKSYPTFWEELNDLKVN